jgi:hypothetical protein
LITRRDQELSTAAAAAITAAMRRAFGIGGRAADRPPALQLSHD